MPTVAVIAFDGVVQFDLAAPCHVFGVARLPAGQPAYTVKVCGVTPTVKTDHFELRVRFGLGALVHADTIVVPGMRDTSAPVSTKLVRALRSARARGARIASVCTGAFVLAEAGLLDGRRAATHWFAADELARRYPKVSVDRDVLYVDDGSIATSAGLAAGLDLCLHLVRRDYGSAVAADAARITVMPLERSGGQSQFIVHAPPADDLSLQPLLGWLEANLHCPLSIEDLARRAAVSVRTLNRRFREQTGATPLKWLLRARVQRAQSLLETSDVSVEAIATRVGFGSPASCREHFQRFLSTTPQAYRRAFRSPAAE